VEGQCDRLARIQESLKMGLDDAQVRTDLQDRHGELAASIKLPRRGAMDVKYHGSLSQTHRGANDR
jgi:hypothetical protein